MGKLKNILIDAQDALLALECKISGEPFNAEPGAVDELRYVADGTFIAGYSYEGAEDTVRVNFVITDNDVVELEAAYFGLLANDSMDLSSEIPSLMEAIAA